MISIISLNIERSKHLDPVVSFLKEQKADVVYLCELAERDVSRFEEVIGPCCVYQCGGLHPADPPENGAIMIGKGLFTSLHVIRNEGRYYRGDAQLARTGAQNTILSTAGLVMCDLEKDGDVFRIVGTHFTWSPKGEPNNQQRHDMQEMLKILDAYKECVLVGDFNAPRMTLEEMPGEIFSKLSSKYEDAIPSHYKTSIDVTLHRAGDVPENHMDKKMVDGLFTTPSYTAINVKLVSGLSDHCAIVAEISTAVT